MSVQVSFPQDLTCFTSYGRSENLMFEVRRHAEEVYGDHLLFEYRLSEDLQGDKHQWKCIQCRAFLAYVKRGQVFKLSKMETKHIHPLNKFKNCDWDKLKGLLKPKEIKFPASPIRYSSRTWKNSTELMSALNEQWMASYPGHPYSLACSGHSIICQTEQRINKICGSRIGIQVDPTSGMLRIISMKNHHSHIVTHGGMKPLKKGKQGKEDPAEGPGSDQPSSSPESLKQEPQGSGEQIKDSIKLSQVFGEMIDDLRGSRFQVLLPPQPEEPSDGTRRLPISEFSDSNFLKIFREEQSSFRCTGRKSVGQQAPSEKGKNTETARQLVTPSGEQDILIIWNRLMKFLMGAFGEVIFLRPMHLPQNTGQDIYSIYSLTCFTHNFELVFLALGVVRNPTPRKLASMLYLFHQNVGQKKQIKTLIVDKEQQTLCQMAEQLTAQIIRNKELSSDQSNSPFSFISHIISYSTQPQSTCLQHQKVNIRKFNKIMQQYKESYGRFSMESFFYAIKKEEGLKKVDYSEQYEKMETADQLFFKKLRASIGLGQPSQYSLNKEQCSPFIGLGGEIPFPIRKGRHWNIFFADSKPSKAKVNYERFVREGGSPDSEVAEQSGQNEGINGQKGSNEMMAGQSGQNEGITPQNGQNEGMAEWSAQNEGMAEKGIKLLLREMKAINKLWFNKGISDSLQAENFFEMQQLRRCRTMMSRKSLMCLLRQVQEAKMLNIIERLSSDVYLICDNTYPYVVSFNKSTLNWLCECRFFDRTGVPCAHILKIHLREENSFLNSISNFWILDQGLLALSQPDQDTIYNRRRVHTKFLEGPQL